MPVSRASLAPAVCVERAVTSHRPATPNRPPRPIRCPSPIPNRSAHPCEWHEHHSAGQDRRDLGSPRPVSIQASRSLSVIMTLRTGCSI